MVVVPDWTGDIPGHHAAHPVRPPFSHPTAPTAGLTTTPSFKVIIPAIIKSIVKDQDLPIARGSLRFTSPTHMVMSMDTMLDTPLGVHIDPMALGLYHSDTASDTPFLTLEIPSQHISGETVVAIPEQEVEVTDEAQLTAWFSDFFSDQQTTPLRAVAHGLTARLGALTYSVDLDKTIAVPALRHLAGFTLVDMAFAIPPGADGNNVRGVLSIPNAGVLAIGLGTLGFYLQAGEVVIGEVFVNDLELRPGNNTPTFQGQFYFDRLMPNIAAILDSQTAVGALAEGYVELNVTGSEALVGPGGAVIPSITSVLRRKTLSLRVPIMTLLGDVLSGLLAGAGSDGAPQGRLLDIVGEVVGNSTLMGGVMDHWESAAAGEKKKRSLQMDLLRLGLRGAMKGGRW